jgi:hypothetical protein
MPSPCESPDICRPSTVPLKCLELPSRSNAVKRISVPRSTTPIKSEVVGHDARSRLELQQPRLEPRHHAGADVERDDRGGGKVRCEEILLKKRCEMRNALFRCLLAREPHEIRLELHANCSCAKVLRRVDRDAPVAGAQIDDDVAVCGVRHLQHPADHPLRGRHPHGVAAYLADLRDIGRSGLRA